MRFNNFWINPDSLYFIYKDLRNLNLFSVDTWPPAPRLIIITFESLQTLHNGPLKNVRPSSSVCMSSGQPASIRPTPTCRWAFAQAVAGTGGESDPPRVRKEALSGTDPMRRCRVRTMRKESRVWKNGHVSRRCHFRCSPKGAGH